MRVGIVGSGLMGGKRGTLFARAGHDVVFSYARRSEKLKALAWKAGRGARAGTPGEADAGRGCAPSRGALVPGWTTCWPRPATCLARSS